MLRAMKRVGVQTALVSAVLLGAGTPAAKLLLDDDVSPWLLAGLLYCGSGIGLGLYRLIRRAPRVRIARSELLPLWGRCSSADRRAGAAHARPVEHAGIRSVAAVERGRGVHCRAGMVRVQGEFRPAHRPRYARHRRGSGRAQYPVRRELRQPWPSLAILAACLSWGLDNNLTRKIAPNDATWLAAVKGGVAGTDHAFRGGVLSLRWLGGEL